MFDGASRPSRPAESGLSQAQLRLVESPPTYAGLAPRHRTQVQKPLRISADGHVQVAVRGGVTDRVQITCQYYVPAVDDHHVLAEVLNDVELMAGEQDGSAGARGP